MNTASDISLLTRSRLSPSALARLYTWIKRTRDKRRAGRRPASVDARTLRDIGLSPREIAVLTIVRARR